MRCVAGLVTVNMSVIQNSLPPESVNYYDTFKDAVFERYRLGPDYFWKKIRNNTPLLRQTLNEFVAQLKYLYQKCKKEAKVNNMEGVDVLMVLD